MFKFLCYNVNNKYLGGDFMGMKGFSYNIYPNNKQSTRMFAIAGATRFVYNWALDFAIKYYEDNEKFISANDITKELTKLKKETDTKWLNEYPNNSLKQSAKNAANAVKDTYLSNKDNHTNNKVHFKSKYHSVPTIYLDSCQVIIDDYFVKLDKISTTKRANRSRLNYVRIQRGHKIPKGLDSYCNPTVKFIDGHWKFSVSVEVEDDILSKVPSQTDGIGIDLGVKDLAICSDGDLFSNANKTNKHLKKCEKRYKQQQRKFSRQYLKNKDENNKIKYSKNMEKQHNKLKKMAVHITNIRNDYIHKTISHIVKKFPAFISIEDLNVKGMMKNKYLARSVQNQKFYYFRMKLTYKCERMKIPLLIVDRWYPSSKTCSRCSNIYKELKLSDRIYNCPKCQLTLDRDFNASLNIREEGRRLLNLQ